MGQSTRLFLRATYKPSGKVISIDRIEVRDFLRFCAELKLREEGNGYANENLHFELLDMISFQRAWHEYCPDEPPSMCSPWDYQVHMARCEINELSPLDVDDDTAWAFALKNLATHLFLSSAEVDAH